MKKLITAVAVLAIAGAVMAAESQNIVGYAKKALGASNFLMVSPQFQGSASSTPLGDAFSGMNDQSVVFTWNGSVYTKYTYFAGFGWFNESFQSADAVPLAAGDGLWLSGASSPVDVLMLGEVPQAASITINLVAGFNMVANPYPVELTLGDLPDVSLSDQDVIFTWDGSTYTKYTYFAGFGWFNESFQSADGVPVAVGDAFWLDSGAGGTMVLNKQF
jgi:hypothetical protein